MKNPSTVKISEEPGRRFLNVPRIDGEHVMRYHHQCSKVRSCSQITSGPEKIAAINPGKSMTVALASQVREYEDMYVGLKLIPDVVH